MGRGNDQSKHRGAPRVSADAMHVTGMLTVSATGHRRQPTHVRQLQQGVARTSVWGAQGVRVGVPSPSAARPQVPGAPTARGSIIELRRRLATGCLRQPAGRSGVAGGEAAQSGRPRCGGPGASRPESENVPRPAARTRGWLVSGPRRPSRALCHASSRYAMSLQYTTDWGAWQTIMLPEHAKPL